MVPSAQPQDWTFELWRGASQFTAGIVEVVAGAALVGGGGAAAGGGVAAAVPTGGASLLITAAGGSAVTAGWAAVGHGATGIVAGLATIANSMSLSKASGSGSLSTEGGLGTPVNKVVNSNMPHAAERAVERAGFRSLEEARTALQEFGAGIEKSGLPKGAIRDTAHPDRVIVPGFGQGGAVVYQIKDGTLKLKTVLEWKLPQ